MQKEPRQAVAESVTDRCRNEFLTFSLGGEDYGVDILRVQEIRGWEAVTRIPNSPLYVKGVLNLRGTIVPVFDLRLRIGMPGREYTKGTVVVVLRILFGIAVPSCPPHQRLSLLTPPRTQDSPPCRSMICWPAKRT